MIEFNIVNLGKLLREELFQSKTNRSKWINQFDLYQCNLLAFRISSQLQQSARYKSCCKKERHLSFVTLHLEQLQHSLRLGCLFDFTFLTRLRQHGYGRCLQQKFLFCLQRIFYRLVSLSSVRDIHLQKFGAVLIVDLIPRLDIDSAEHIQIPG